MWEDRSFQEPKEKSILSQGYLTCEHPYPAEEYPAYTFFKSIKSFDDSSISSLCFHLLVPLSRLWVELQKFTKLRRIFRVVVSVTISLVLHIKMLLSIGILTRFPRTYTKGFSIEMVGQFPTYQHKLKTSVSSSEGEPPRFQEHLRPPLRSPVLSLS